MKIYSVFDPEFKAYGQVITGIDTAELVKAMDQIPMPPEGVAYEPSIPELESCRIFRELEYSGFGGMPMQLGMCWGHNVMLNCLEYHRDSEINIGTGDFILLVAQRAEITEGKLDTSCVKAFRAPAGAVVEVFATTLHYAPCQVEEEGFRVAILLPRGTNTEKPAAPEGTAKENANEKILTPEDKMLFARNKWLLAHKDSAEAGNGAWIGLTGENLSVK
ncbi:MAG: DUF4867 family protein [Lachnospiraceae bacterium]|nr:DUF4867 family protein [Lachnospiraceae bacterium]